MAGADAIVVGAGAAGIAAARRLHDAGLDVLLVEAGNRLGGRAHSIDLPFSPGPSNDRPDAGPRLSPGNMVVDLGCGWLHSAKRNPWTQLAEDYGFTVDRAPANWRAQWRDLGFSPAERAGFHKAWQRWQEAAHAALPGPDQPLSAFLAPDDPWRPLIDAISGYANGAPLARVSLHDWAAYEDSSTEDNWAVREGYGTLVARHARGLAVQLDTLVTRIDHSGPILRLDTSRGTIETAHAIICVPTTALAEERVVFDPPLLDKHEAAGALPLGLADKVFLRVEGEELPDNGHLIGNPHKSCTASYRLGPFGWPLIECFFGGDCAEAMESAGDGAAADFAIRELVGLLGSDWRSRLTPVAATRWRAEPHIHGSYSHAHIGAAPQRAVLAAPVDDRLFFAGEACSKHDFSTAHGAYETGVAAAEALIGTLDGASRFTAPASLA
ncbi:MAG: FAD-dependent oxidoreductase [Sphingomonas bacterium]|uniref:flavin monoamine oxidase family protein n=1 Tax=Sphingomonas bacterium TaxID=1895847 RepID=UPI00260B20C7|nr:NAD(P)/FAD-dependent oxidoreductase [Sphingomonas bacterium]MDB5703424.1 FAD-dependent oxidoreductase [Sphingomonas bacterium]